jgi:DNA ligase-1
VYDVDEPGLTFEERHELLKALLANSEFLRPVETRIVNNHEELIKAYEEYVALGYEGLMIRNLDSEYEGKRSYGLQKLKGFIDREFKIIGIKEGKGKLQGHAATFICVTDAGKEFDAKMEGELSRLKEFFENHSLWQGKILTVRFQNWTKKGVPRIGVGLRIREDL